jgi:hypothetical protein
MTTAQPKPRAAGPAPLTLRRVNKLLAYWMQELASCRDDVRDANNCRRHVHDLTGILAALRADAKGARHDA